MINEELIVSTTKELMVALIEQCPGVLNLSKRPGDETLIDLGNKFDLMAKSISKKLKGLNV